MMEATLIIRCHCGDNYAVVCPSCKESPKAEVCPKGTLDALRAVLPLAEQYAEDVTLTPDSPGRQFIEAARAALDAAGEGKPRA